MKVQRLAMQINIIIWMCAYMQIYTIMRCSNINIYTLKVNYFCITSWIIPSAFFQGAHKTFVIVQMPKCTINQRLDTGYSIKAQIKVNIPRLAANYIRGICNRSVLGPKPPMHVVLPINGNLGAFDIYLLLVI